MLGLRKNRPCRLCQVEKLSSLKVKPATRGGSSSEPSWDSSYESLALKKVSLGRLLLLKGMEILKSTEKLAGRDSAIETGSCAGCKNISPKPVKISDCFCL